MSKALTQPQITAILTGLSTICVDSAQGFAAASREVPSEGLRILLSDAAVQREQFARELQEVAATLGETVTPQGTVLGAAHRGWMHLQSIFSGGDEPAILDACLTEEQRAHEAYRQALLEPLPASVRALLDRHFQSILRVSQGLVQLQSAVRRNHGDSR